MLTNRIALAVAALAFVTPAMAQDGVQLKDLDADRINANQIKIEFEYDGGACESVDPAQLGEITDGSLAVTFPIVSTAEVCTMQVVEHEIEQAVDADESVTRVEVTLLAPDGSVVATGTTEVDDD